jgi:DNA-binding GntR family transcriptional regulator
MVERGVTGMGGVAGAVERTSVAEQVAAALREAILAGSLGPGTSLREVALGERFAVSRATVREAIRALVTQGLVQHSMHRGAVVAEPSPDDVVDVYRARTAVEIAAAGEVRRATPADLDELADALRAMEGAFARRDWNGTAEADLAFHRRLVALAGSPRLDGFYANLQGELRLVLLLADRDAPDEGKVAEHRRMLDLAVRGDVEGLRAALSRHVTAAQDVLLRVLRARSTP